MYEKELEVMMQKVYANEKALKYLHGFVKMMISRYGIQWGRVMDYKAEIMKLIEQIECTWLLKIVYETVVNIVKP